MTIIDSLFVALGFSADTDGLEKMEVYAEHAKKAMAGFAVAITGAGLGIVHLVESTAEKMASIQDFSELVGVSATEIDALGKVAAENDSSLEEMKSTIQAITVATGQAAAGFGRAKIVFQKFGLSAKNADGSTKSFEEMISQVADKMQGMDRGKQLALGSRLGISPMLVKLIAEGKENFKGLVEEAKAAIPFTNAEYELADKTEKSFAKARKAAESFGKRVAVALMPQVTGVLKKFTAWVKDSDNISKITRFVQNLINVMQFLYKHMNKILGLVATLYTYKMGAYFLGLGEAAVKAGRGLLSLTTYASLLKTLLTGALAAALALVAEDLWAFYNGGESVTGWLLTEFPRGVDIAIAAIGVLSAAFLALVTGSGPLGLVILGLTGLVSIARQIYADWNPIKQWFVDIFDSIRYAIDDAVRSMQNFTGVSGVLNALGFGGDISQRDLDRRANSTLGKMANWGPAQSPAGEPSIFNNMAGLLTGKQTAWNPGSREEEPDWLTKKKGGNTTVGDVHFHLPNAKDTKEGAREGFKELRRQASGGIKG